MMLCTETRNFDHVVVVLARFLQRREHSERCVFTSAFRAKTWRNTVFFQGKEYHSGVLLLTNLNKKLAHRDFILLINYTVIVFFA